MLKKAKGFSLIELIVSLALGAAVVSALFSLLTHITTHFYKVQQFSRLVNEIHVLSLAIDNHVRQAGYDGSAHINHPLVNGKSSQFSQALSLALPGPSGGYECVQFSYDTNNDGVFTPKKPNEQFGYRLKDGSIEVPMGSATCTSGMWQDLTDKAFITITQFQIEKLPLTSSTPRTMLAFRLTARLSRKPEIEQQIEWLTPVWNSDE